MSWLELPHTAGCLVCGRDNPVGLHLRLLVDPATGVVRVTFTPGPQHIGFEGIVHGGVLATVLDEAMVWAATWAGKRFCVCGELTVRFRRSPLIGQTLETTAEVEGSRPKLVQTVGRITDTKGQVIAQALGKYVPLSAQRHEQFLSTFIDEPATAEAARAIKEEFP